MRCLYCGKELALLKRWTGGGEFCSDAHKQSYQEEYDRIALGRLLQAQKKTQKSVAEPPQPVAPVAVPPTPPAVEEAVEELETEQAPTTVSEPAAPEVEVPEMEPDAAGFLFQQPTPAEMPGLAAQLEFSVESAAPEPIAPQAHFSRTSPALAPAGPVPMPVTSTDFQTSPAGSEANLPAPDVPFGEIRPSLPPGLVLRSAPSRLPAVGRAIRIEVPLIALKVAASKIGALDFPIVVKFDASALLSFELNSGELQADQSDTAVPATSAAPAARNNGSAFEPLTAQVLWTHPAMPSKLDASSEDPAQPLSDDTSATPHATLEALSRLHDAMQVEPNAAQPVSASVAVEVTVAGPMQAVVEEAAPESNAPRGSAALLDIPIKVMAPPKRVPAHVNALSPAAPASLPRLRGLPLRPKVAVAPSGSVPQARTAEPLATAAPAKVNEPKVEVKPQPAPKPPAAAAKPKAPGSNKPATPAKPAQQTASSTDKPPQAAKTTEAASKAAETNPKPKQPVRREQPARVESSAPKAADPAPEPKPAQPSVAMRLDTKVEDVPSFGSIGRPASFWGSFKVKLGVGILVLAGCAAYFALSGKSQKVPIAAPQTAVDSAGPSIILGEGGWVVGWGGDAAAPAAGREITIYRPSLKLSDYRIEFQGDIESKSLGWVFRAADPDNYYAMKLTTVSTTPPAKVALFKYIVVKGRSTQVGRVPVDLDVSNDTVFKVRVDVRGPKFSTYVQSQPVDVWTDDQLKAGGVGFLNERGERGRIKSVSIRYLSGDDK